MPARPPSALPAAAQIEAEMQELCEEYNARIADARPVKRLLTLLNRSRDAYWAARAADTPQPIVDPVEF